MGSKKAFYNIIFYGMFASIYIFSCVEETSPSQVAIYEKSGFNGHLTFGGRFKYATFLNMVGTGKFEYLHIDFPNFHIDFSWVSWCTFHFRQSMPWPNSSCFV